MYFHCQSKLHQFVKFDNLVLLMFDIVTTMLSHLHFLQDAETAALIRKLDDRKREAVQRKQ